MRRARAVGAALVLGLAVPVVSASTAQAMPLLPGLVHNVDGSGDSVLARDIRRGPDGYVWVPAGQWSPKHWTFDVDRVIAPCAQGTIRMRLRGPDWNMGHEMRVGAGGYPSVYVRGC